MRQKKEGGNGKEKWKWETLIVPNVCYESTPLDVKNDWQELCRLIRKWLPKCDILCLKALTKTVILGDIS